MKNIAPRRNIERNTLRKLIPSLFRGASQPADHDSAPVVTDPAQIARESGSVENENVYIRDRSPIADNDNWFEQKIRKPWLTRQELRARRRSRRLTVKAWRWVKGKVKPELTAAELMDKEENQRRKEMDKTHREGAKRVNYMLVRELTRLGFRYEEKDGDRRRVDKVRFGLIEYSPLAYKFYVSHLPWNVNSVLMTSEETCINLARAVGKKVRGYNNPNDGLMYVVEVGSTNEIPDFVKFSDMTTAMPKNLPDLAFPVGVTSNGRKVYDSFENVTHLLVAGKTNGGKSNEVNALICSLLMRNKPETLRMVLIDLKGGLEFDGYAGIPHLHEIPEIESGIVQRNEDVLKALNWIIKEGKRRIKLLKKSTKRNISDFNRNRKKGNRLARLLLVIDEYASIALSEIGADGERLLTKITNEMRAVGIHVLISTQYPNTKVISTQITNNFAARMAFSMGQHGSQTVLGSWEAFNLSPVGRMYWQPGSDGMQVQAPRITDTTIASVVAMAKGESKEVVMNTLDIEEILTWALQNASGRLSRDDLFSQFSDHITKVELNDMLQDAEGKVFVITETPYRIEPAAGSRPRQMVKVKSA